MSDSASSLALALTTNDGRLGNHLSVAFAFGGIGRDRFIRRFALRLEHALLVTHSDRHGFNNLLLDKDETLLIQTVFYHVDASYERTNMIAGTSERKSRHFDVRNPIDGKDANVGESNSFKASQRVAGPLLLGVRLGSPSVTCATKRTVTNPGRVSPGV